jgi:hypothetical protein
VARLTIALNSWEARLRLHWRRWRVQALRGPADATRLGLEFLRELRQFVRHRRVVECPPWLQHLHDRLDRAVYGWDDEDPSVVPGETLLEP